jgi:hypothetical protein
MLRRLKSKLVPDRSNHDPRPATTPNPNPTIAEKPDTTSVETVIAVYKEELEVGGYHAKSIYTAEQ